MPQAIYKFNLDCGRNGGLEGVFVASKEDVSKIMGKEVYYGEVLGKHSEVYADLTKDQIEEITEDPKVVALFNENNLDTGFNPIEIYMEDQE